MTFKKVAPCFQLTVTSVSTFLKKANMTRYKLSVFLILTGICAIFTSPASVAGAPPQISGAEYFYGQDSNGIQVMCVIQKPHPNGDGVSFKAWNGMTVPITVLFKPKLENLKADANFPMLLIIPAGSTKAAYSARVVNHSQPHTWENNWTWRIGTINASHDKSILYARPFPKTSNFKIVQGYNGRGSHQGEFTHSIDWDMPIGTPVLAARPGTVGFIRDAFSGHSTDPSWKERTNTVTIYHDDGTMAEYSHIKQHSARVKVGDRVETAGIIALSADVGYAVSPHLHFRVFRNRETPHGIVEESLPVLFKGPDGKPEALGR